jgi:putative addiction module component (TIGR02574 family)
MTPTLESLGIDRLPIAERIALIHQIWASVAEALPRVELTEARRQELRERAAGYEANPDDVVSWETIRADALARFPR